jgi:hypothetical protein
MKNGQCFREKAAPAALKWTIHSIADSFHVIDNSLR